MGSRRLVEILEKRLEHAHRHPAVQQQPAREYCDAHLPKAVDHADGRVDGVHHKVCFLSGPRHLLVGVVHPAGAFLLLIKGFDDDPPAVILLYQPG